MSETLATQDEAVSSLLAYVFSGAIGPPEGKGVGYSLIEATPTAFSWLASLEYYDGPPEPVDRYLIKIDRRSREICSPEPIVLSETELAEAIFAATGHHLASSRGFTGRRAKHLIQCTVEESLDIAYVVQLRHHGRVASMDSLMALISRTIDHQIFPVPSVYPIPGEMKRQAATRMGRQITRYIPGVMASSVYPRLLHEERLVLVRKIALAFQACWRIQLADDHLIGACMC